jgi:hypothetical protein
MVAEGIMSINMLKKSKIFNLDYDGSLTPKSLNRTELRTLIGEEYGTITLAASGYMAVEAHLGESFYCEEFNVGISGSNYGCSVWVKPTITDPYVSYTAEAGAVNFRSALPNRSTLVYGLRLLIENYGDASISISGAQLNTVDYPVGFDYAEFSVVASSHHNDPIKIYNHSVEGTAKDIRVMPLYTGNYTVDRLFILTESGKEDTNRYHADRGITIPESIPWASGLYNNIVVSGTMITLSGTTTSGVYTSPAIYVEDSDYVSMYVYGEYEDDQAIVEKDWQTVNNLVEVRASNETPLPYFLINSWTRSLWIPGDSGWDWEAAVEAMAEFYHGAAFTPQTYDSPVAARRPSVNVFQTVPGYTSSEWWGYCPETSPAFAVGGPYIYGRSSRIYMKGDGTVIAAAPDDVYQMGSRNYSIGVPYKFYGAINDHWSACFFPPTLGRFIEDDLSTRGCWGHQEVAQTFWWKLSYATESDDSLWTLGKDIGGDTMEQMYPFISHYCGDHELGCASWPTNYDIIGTTVIPIRTHPNEWLVLVTEMFPFAPNEPKYMVTYLFAIRNWWVYNRTVVGAWGIGLDPCEEGFAICKCESNDGFWLHVGYTTMKIYKYTQTGEVEQSYSVKRGYSALRETTDGLWAIRNTGVYYYQETGGELVVQFKVETGDFQFLQAGDVDASGNLWVVDRDSSTVYRINSTTGAVDYELYIPYVVGVWPHPTDGTAFVYIGFHPDTFSTAIKKISVDDPYGYVDLVTTVGSPPLSDVSGVQFQGKLSNTYITPGNDDPVWGTNDNITLEWQPYPNSGLALPGGKYKQFRITLQREGQVIPPHINKVRIPAPLLLRDVPFGDYKNVYINPHLRYNKETGRYTTDLRVWWPHGS